MPIYEFYCPDCHRIFSFLSRRVNPRRRPDCPACGRRGLERRASRFAVSRGHAGPAADVGGGPDESRLEQAMGALSSEMEHLDENDPRQMAGLMRKLYDATGLPVGPGVEEAIRRMEAGEDPDRVEEELGEVLGEDPFGDEAADPAAPGPRRALRPPSVDETLYEM